MAAQQRTGLNDEGIADYSLSRASSLERSAADDRRSMDDGNSFNSYVLTPGNFWPFSNGNWPPPDVEKEVDFNSKTLTGSSFKEAAERPVNSRAEAQTSAPKVFGNFS